MKIKLKAKTKSSEDRKGNRTKERELNFSYDSLTLIQLAKKFFG